MAGRPGIGNTQFGRLRPGATQAELVDLLPCVYSAKIRQNSPKKNHTNINVI